MFGQNNQDDKTQADVPKDENTEENQQDTAVDSSFVDAANASDTAPVSTDDPASAFAISDSGAFGADSGLDSVPIGADSNELLIIKQEALRQLTPLVGLLDQTPEERYRTTMMMIQASDNQALIKDAYAAAQKITDEKVRAQALLDIVNEINYFTQQQSNQ